MQINYITLQMFTHTSILILYDTEYNYVRNYDAMLSGSYTTTKQSNIHSHHLHPNRHVFNPLKSSAVTQYYE
jgi:uncharacterized membrane protein YgaE (UPF0421/DUF939 family)